MRIPQVAQAVTPRAARGNLSAVEEQACLYNTVPMSVPLPDLDAQCRPLRDALLAAITRVQAAVMPAMASLVQRHVGAAS